MNPDNIIFEELYGGLINTEKKLDSSYSNEQKEAIKNVSIDENEAYPFGSASYKIQLYPGDLDVRETVFYKEGINTIVNDFSKKLQNLVKNIEGKRMVYFGEAKIGFDKRFQIDIGDIDNLQVTNYHPTSIIRNIRKTFSKYGLNEEMQYLISLVKNNPTIDDWDKLYKAMRDYFIVRWNATEILQGYKILPGNVKLKLTDALKHKTMVKIDTWQYINGRFIEVTNFFIIVQEKDGKIALLNLPDDFHVRADKTLLEEVDKLMCSGEFFKPLKAVKRMWTIAMIRDDQKVLEVLTPLINSSVGVMNQVNGDIESIIGILENTKSIPMQSIRKEIDNFKVRLAHVYDININLDHVNQIFNEIYKLDDRNEMINKLGKIKKMFQDIINRETIQYLIDNGLYPIPHEYLPINSKYCNNLF
jgi:hypothetical protein